MSLAHHSASSSDATHTSTRLRESEPTAALTAAQAVADAEAEGLALVRADTNSGYRNVSHRAARKANPYEAHVRRGGKMKSLGYFATAEQAALAVARTPEGAPAAAAAAAAAAAPAAAPTAALSAAQAVADAEAEGLTLLKSEGSSTGYKGVHFDKNLPRPYLARVWRGGKLVHLGCYATAEQAALVVARTPEGQAAAAPPPMAALWQRAEVEAAAAAAAPSVAAALSMVQARVVTPATSSGSAEDPPTRTRTPQEQLDFEASCQAIDAHVRQSKQDTCEASTDGTALSSSALPVSSSVAKPTPEEQQQQQRQQRQQQLAANHQMQQQAAVQLQVATAQPPPAMVEARVVTPATSSGTSAEHGHAADAAAIALAGGIAPLVSLTASQPRPNAEAEDNEQKRQEDRIAVSRKRWSELEARLTADGAKRGCSRRMTRSSSSAAAPSSGGYDDDQVRAAALAVAERDAHRRAKRETVSAAHRATPGRKPECVDATSESSNFYFSRDHPQAHRVARALRAA